MALVLADRVKETTTTSGTSDFVLGGAVSGFQTFSASVGNSNTTYYAIANNADWEVGLGTLSSDGLTLARTTVLQSSNSDSKVSFASGSKEVFVTYPADKSIYKDSSGNAIALGTIVSATLTNATGLPLTTGVTGTLPVANGGTGATTLTGYVKGTGTSALTASSTIPNTDISGLGTIATQNANNVAITGGTINGTSIGATTASTGEFTSLTVNDNATFGSSNTDTVNFVGRISSDFDPASDNTYDLGRTGHEWRNLYLTGTGNIDSLIADTADINGGTIDATAIGSTTPSSGAFTTVTASTAIAVASGGTGQTTYTDGQLLIGNSTGNTLSKATLTAGSGISITNGSGAITIASSGGSLFFPFYKADGTSDTISLVSGTSLPFFNSSGTAKNIALTT